MPAPANERTHDLKGWWLLWGLWLLGAVVDRLWFALDRSVPSWDPADYLTGSMNYWQALQHPQWFSDPWWTSLWRLSSKIPPLTYIVTAPFLNIFGTGPDGAALVNLLFSAILLGSVFSLGRHLFHGRVGLWAAGLCLLFPGLYRVRLDFLLDYPLTAVVTLSFFCLTVWRDRYSLTLTRQTSPAIAGQKPKENRLSHWPTWGWTIAVGISLGLALMVKQTAVLFLAIPLFWVTVETLWQRAWGRLLQLTAALLLSTLVWGGWYRTNWLLILTSSKRATVDSAIAEGDPALNTWEAWTYYWHQLPAQLSWPLLGVSLAGLVVCLFRARIAGLEGKAESHRRFPPFYGFQWLAVFWIGAYFLCSLNINKDIRYVLPYLPVTAIFLAKGLWCWGWRVRWATVGVAMGLALVNLFAIAPLQFLAHTPHQAYMGADWPHSEVVAEIVRTEPHLRSTLGVLPSTPEINQHNFSYYGTLANFQVYGRQVGVRSAQIPQDARSLSWFLTKTGDQGSVPPAQGEMVQAIEQSPEFELHRSWDLPDGSQLRLYHRRSPPVVVRAKEGDTTAEVQLEGVEVPDRVPPGFPVPVTYSWSGDWEGLRSGLVLLTWRWQSETPLPAKVPSDETNPIGEETIASTTARGSEKSNGGRREWLHDRAIGMGQFVSFHGPGQFTVTETTAMLPPANLASGIYTLEATYMNRKTGEGYPLAIAPVSLKIDPSASPIPAPELDWVTQLRQWAKALPQGVEALTPVFDEVGRINQYDGVQDYLEQGAIALEFRLQEDPNNAEWAYGVGLARVLQKRIDRAIVAFERVVEIDGQNPYAYAYLAFVNLCDFRPVAAQTALNSAFELNPDIPELRILRGVAALMRGNVVQAWRDAQMLLVQGGES